MGKPPIAVFGSSEPREGDPLYDEARRLGALLAGSGHAVVTGGYGGVMEAASRGAVESGGTAVGVTCDIFGERRPNRFLSEVLRSADLHERTRLLIERCGGFVVLPGKAGTLAELGLLWALHRAGCLDGCPVILLGDAWSGFLSYLMQAGMLDAHQLEITRVADSPERAMEVLSEMLPSAEER